jgi:two-component system response regulator AtoC
MPSTVLVVDDEPAMRELLRRWVSGWGYTVRTAARAPEALEAMLADPAEIMLVDITLPGHDGFWLVERVRAKWPRTAFIMATAAAEIDLIERSKRAGAADYVLKPFGRELLWQALDRAMTVVHTK